MSAIDELIKGYQKVKTGVQNLPVPKASIPFIPTPKQNFSYSLQPLTNISNKFIAGGIPRVLNKEPAPVDLASAFKERGQSIKKDFLNIPNVDPLTMASAFSGGSGAKSVAGDLKGLIKNLAKDSNIASNEAKLVSVGVKPVDAKILAPRTAAVKTEQEVGDIILNHQPVGLVKSKIPLTGAETPQELLALVEKKAEPLGITPKSFTPIPRNEQIARDLATEKNISLGKQSITQSISKDQIQAQIEHVQNLIDEHPIRNVQKFQSRKEGQFEDYKNPNVKTHLGKFKYTDSQKKNIIKKNERMNIAIRSEFGNSKYAGRGDDIDAIREAQDEYNNLKESLQFLKQQKRDLPKVQISAEGIPMARKSVPILPQVNQPLPQKAFPIDTTTGEGRSLEIVASQSGGEYISEKIVGKDDASLLDTVSKESTPVKNKVNIIDYIRTPDRVLKKIGMEKEVADLRIQHEKYLKELPKNIDKITQWSKRVSPNGNEAIFNYLDGKAIDLLPQDKAVATEIQAWLKKWADRLGLPEDNRITYYITHIFDQELLAKEFPEELAKMIDKKIPGEVYDPFLEKRLGTLGYRQDTWAALDAYVKRATRKVHMDPALEKVKDASGKLEKSQYDYVQSYVNNINMRPNNIDNLIDNGIKQIIGYKLRQRPTLVITKFLRQMTYRAMLGLNPASALKNISQGINTYAVLGEKYTAIGYMKLFQKGGKAELEAEGILNAGFIEDRALSSTKKAIEKFDNVLFSFFEKAEHINRGAAYFGAKAQGLAKGMGEREAIDYAKKIVRDTQFVFGKIDTPLILSSDLGKTLGQFQSFTTKQMEFLYEMGKKAATGDEKAKNFIGLLRYAIAGTVFIYTIGQAFNMKISDLIPGYRIGVPPSLKLPIEIGKAAINAPDKYGKERDLKKKLKDVGNTLFGIFPGGIQGKKTYQGYQALQEGKSTDSAGRSQYDVGGTVAKDAQALIFGKYAGQGAQDFYENDMTYAEATLKNLQKSKTPKEDLLKIAKENPALAKNVLQVIKKQALGITKDDEKLLNLGVANKARATEVARQLNKLKTNSEKKALMLEYAKKKIITEDVLKQVLELVNK